MRERLGMPYWQAQNEARLFGKTASVLALGNMRHLNLGEAIALAGDDAHEIRSAFNSQSNLDFQTKSGVGSVGYGSGSQTPAWSSVAQGVYDQSVLGNISGATRL